MKKIAVFFTLLAFGASVSAQRGIEIGAFVTPQSTWIFNQQDFDAGDELNFRSTFGFAGGINAGMNFTNTFGIRTGIGFSRQGQNYINDILNDEYSLNMSYIRVPLLLKFNSDPSARTSFLGTIGADFGFLSGATVEGTILGIPVDADVKDEYNGVDIAAVAGLGLQYNITENVNLNFLIRLSYSVVDIEAEDRKPAGRESANHFIGGFQIGANYVLFGGN